MGKDDSAYWVHRSAQGFRGKNPRHALVAEFTRHGAEVRSHNLRWGLATRGYGYGDAVHQVEAVPPQANANRVEYRREGVTEWYENGPLGLEQGFTLAHPPGKATGQALTVELALRGDLVAVLESAGKAIELRRKNGQAALRYTGLKARDATGRELRSWLEVRGERLLVRVEDGGARYPVVVDPWVQRAELTASDGAFFDQFGISVAVSGSTAVVGANLHTVGSNTDQGAAYVFVESGGTWSQQAELTASDGGKYDNFGWSVAASGSTAVVGAFQHMVGSNTQQGAAYVMGTPDFQLSVSTSNLTIVAGQSGNAVLTVTPVNGFNSQVSFTCSGLPSEATCSFNPTSVTPNGSTVSSTLTINTTAASAERRAPSVPRWRPLYAIAFPVLGTLLGTFPRRRLELHRRRLFGFLLLLMVVAAQISCGGGGGSGGGGGNPGTSAGTYTVSITASASGAGAANSIATLTVTITH